MILWLSPSVLQSLLLMVSYCLPFTDRETEGQGSEGEVGGRESDHRGGSGSDRRPPRLALKEQLLEARNREDSGKDVLHTG